MTSPIALITCEPLSHGQLERLRHAGFEPVHGSVVLQERSRVRVLIAGLEMIDRPMLESFPSLGLVALTSTGTDNIDLEVAAELGVRVSNVPSQASEEVASHALALMLALLRNLPMHDRNLREGLWDSRRDIVPAPRVSTLTLGIIGLGNIGRSLAFQSQNIFGEIIGFDPVASPVNFENDVKRVRSMAEVVAQADVLTVHVPRTREITELLKDIDLESSPVRYVINVSRGGLFSHARLLDLLETGALDGVGIDTFDPEPPGLDPLLMHPRTISTPHRAFESVSSLLAYERFPVDNVIAFATGTDLVSPIDR